MYGCMDVCLYECMDVWMYGCMDVWMYGCMAVCGYVVSPSLYHSRQDECLTRVSQLLMAIYRNKAFLQQTNVESVALNVI